MAVTAYVNGEPRTQLELLEGFQKIPFGAGEASFSTLAVALDTSDAPVHSHALWIHTEHLPSVCQLSNGSHSILAALTSLDV